MLNKGEPDSQPQRLDYLMITLAVWGAPGGPKLFRIFFSLGESHHCLPEYAGRRLKCRATLVELARPPARKMFGAGANLNKPEALIFKRKLWRNGCS